VPLSDRLTVSVRDDGVIVSNNHRHDPQDDHAEAYELAAALKSLGLEVTRTDIKRATLVDPDHPALRFLFYFCRELFGDAGWIAEFTRSWPCLWRVDTSPSGGPVLDGRWRNREDALMAEGEWLCNHL
jgi:hypothetical protein